MNRYESLKWIAVGFGWLSGLLSGAVAAQPAAAAIGKTPLTGIAVAIEDQNLGQFGVSLLATDLAQRVAHNLSEWHYPANVGSGNNSHRLVVTVGTVATGDTPVGFSFSAGNTDPRSLDFQKAQVLPIRCHLTNSGSAEGGIENKTTVSARSLQDAPTPSNVADKLVNHISTACFELLDTLKLPATGNRLDTQSFKPRWMPDVQVEVKQVPALNTRPTAATSIEESPGETRKHIIIHNQGSPVIIEMGHERK